MNNKNSVKIDVPGGLGNQLFTYFAGLYISHKLEARIVVDTSGVDAKHTSNTHNLLSFRLPHDFEQKNKPLFAKYQDSSSFLDRVRFKVLRRLNHYSRSTYEVFSDSQSFSDINRQINDFQRLSKPRRVLVTGYFQRPEFYDELPVELKTVGLVAESDAFIAAKEVISNIKPIGIHLRLGDFTQISEIYGVLAVDYYRLALVQISGTIGVDVPILVFTNDVVLARKILQPIIEMGMGISFVHEVVPNISDPAEELILLSMCRAIVIANSTFSIWAARLSASGTPIYYPSPFYRNSDDLKFNFPASWLGVPATWHEFAGSQLPKDMGR